MSLMRYSLYNEFIMISLGAASFQTKCSYRAAVIYGFLCFTI